MNNKQITYRGQNVLLGANNGAYGIGRAHFIVFQEDYKIRAFYILGQRSNDVYKKITMNWVEVEIYMPVIELKPLPEYYNADGTCKYGEKVIRCMDSTSEGKMFVAPNVEMYIYDVFYNLVANAKAGKVLYGIGVDRFFKEKFRTNILNTTTMQFYQPVTVDIENTIDNITITPIDGIAPFLYSLNGGTFQANNVFDITELDKEITNLTVTIKDVEGTTITEKVQRLFPAETEPLPTEEPNP